MVWFDSSRKQVWMSERLSLGSGDESGMPIVDLDGDGRHAGQFIRDAAFAGRANVAPYGFCRMARRRGLVSNGGKQISMTICISLKTNSPGTAWRQSANSHQSKLL